MIFKEKQRYVLIRINTPKEIHFIEEHQKIIDEFGHVYFYKVGRPENLIRMLPEQHLIILRDTKSSHNKTYICEIDGYSQSTPTKAFPHYYNDFFPIKAFG